MTDRAYKRAKEILGMKFITPESLKRCTGNPIFRYTKEQLFYLRDTLPDEQSIWWAFHNHAVVYPGPAKETSVLDLHTSDPYRLMEPLNPWFVSSDEEFVPNETALPLQWYMMRVTAHPRLVEHSIRVQMEIYEESDISKTEEWANAGEIAYYLFARSLVIGHDVGRLIVSSSLTSESESVTLHDAHYYDGKSAEGFFIDISKRAFDWAEKVHSYVHLGLRYKF